MTTLTGTPAQIARAEITRRQFTADSAAFVAQVNALVAKNPNQPMAAVTLRCTEQVIAEWTAQTSAAWWIEVAERTSIKAAVKAAIDASK